MNERILRITEYDKITDRLAGHATSDPGRALCHALTPMTKLSEINRAQDETADALSFLFRKGSVNFGSNRDFTQEFRALSVGASLSAPELLHLASFLENVAAVRAYGVSEDRDRSALRVSEDSRYGASSAAGRTQNARAASANDHTDGTDPAGSGASAAPRNTLSDLFECLVPMPHVTAEIRRCIPAEDIIADDASPALKGIRRSMLQANERIHSQLQKMVNGSTSQYLQDAVITVRDDRYCLPVRAEFKNSVPGIVHDQSATGSTLFIEPAAVVEQGNKLRELEVEEKKEIERILAALSAEAGEQLLALRDNQKNMTTLDFLFAKAELAVDMDATRPLFNDRHYLVLHGARHPLIDKKKCVPIDIGLGRNFDMVVITGPNTGGKTVTLKTVGLLELMGMSGLHIPASDRSELSLFREVFADIGDEQSIEQNLSTFSSHMRTIVDILKRADKNCLCLIDELGAGTDPSEGAALAISILNFMHTRGIRTLATTHYSELKIYAMRTDGVMNASCEFDVDSLQPTYRLIMGIAGKSNAFAISKRLGIPNYIIETAREQMSTETKDFEDLLTELDTERTKAEKERREVEAMRAELDKREKALTDREKQMNEKRTEIIRRANESARDILANAKKEADEAISDIRRGMVKGGTPDTADLEKVRSSLREKVTRKEMKISAATRPDADERTGRRVKADELKVGDRVRIIKMGLTGTVQTLPDGRGNLSVLCGMIHTKVNVKDLVWDEAPAAPQAKFGAPAGSSRAQRLETARRSESVEMDFSRVAGISAECNLLGQTTDEAILTLDKYLDDARMAHLDKVRVVHGKGTGALRKAVWEYLRTHKSFIRSYRMGEFGEGDAGVTIVEL